MTLLATATLLATFSLQAPVDSTRFSTLAAWQVGVHTSLLDRVGNWGGTFFDRGLFRRYTREMDHEYGVDIATASFTLVEDYQFFASRNAFRSRLVSIDKSQFGASAQAHVTYRIANRQTGYIDVNFNEDLQRERALFRFGYDFAFSTSHAVGLWQTVGRYKPDLDFSVFYRYSTPRTGVLRVTATLLDVANNFIFDRIGVDPVHSDTVRVYSRKPRLFEAAYATPRSRGLRAEVFLGVHPRSSARYSSQTVENNTFDIDEWYSYGGAVANYVRGWSTTTVSLRQTLSRQQRTAPSGSRFSSDYTTRQRDRTFLIAQQVNHRLGYAAADLELSSYHDRQAGSDFDQSSIQGPIDYRERRYMLRLRILRVPERRGALYGLGLLTIRRTSVDDLEALHRYLRFFQNKYNGRLSPQAGYRFSDRVSILFGVSYDLDGDDFYTDGRGKTRFDGGFFQVLSRW